MRKNVRALVAAVVIGTGALTMTACAAPAAPSVSAEVVTRSALDDATMTYLAKEKESLELGMQALRSQTPEDFQAASDAGYLLGTGSSTAVAWTDAQAAATQGEKDAAAKYLPTITQGTVAIKATTTATKALGTSYYYDRVSVAQNEVTEFMNLYNALTVQ